MEYRLNYEYLTRNKIPVDFDIHHIDFNRKNNNIKNLVALPKSLHADYHKIIKRLNDYLNNNSKYSKGKIIEMNNTLKKMSAEIELYIQKRDIQIFERNN